MLVHQPACHRPAVVRTLGAAGGVPEGTTGLRQEIPSDPVLATCVLPRLPCPTAIATVPSRHAFQPSAIVLTEVTRRGIACLECAPCIRPAVDPVDLVDRQRVYCPDGSPCPGRDAEQGFQLSPPGARASAVLQDSGGIPGLQHGLPRLAHGEADARRHRPKRPVQGGTPGCWLDRRLYSVSDLATRGRNAAATSPRANTPNVATHEAWSWPSAAIHAHGAGW